MDALLLVALILGGTAALSWPLGRYLRWAGPPPPAALAGRFARLFLRLGGRRCRQAQDWRQYVLAMLGCNAVMFVGCFLLLALQQHLPLNPDGKPALQGSLIFNTAASFVT